ncbi:MAG: CRISPR-associated DxTHG motif protein [Candidatus Stahlbacteria bacterium]|nr:MAG: CRISPR-associated DxTHG motif protein [Candidatus Stahlbacteria bacterium]
MKWGEHLHSLNFIPLLFLRLKILLPT